MVGRTKWKYLERLLVFEIELCVMLSGKMEVEWDLCNNLIFESLMRIGAVQIGNGEGE
jgi:hypothetical protein